MQRKKVRLDELSLKEINKFLKGLKLKYKIFDVLSSMNSKTSCKNSNQKY